MLCLCSIASVLLLAAPADLGPTAPAGPPVGAANPLDDADAPPPASTRGSSPRAFAPLDPGAARPPAPDSAAASAPLGAPPGSDLAPPHDVAAPLAGADARDAAARTAPDATPATDVPRRIEMVRVELLVGPVWRIRTTEVMALAGLEFGRLRGFSGAVQGGIIVAPDRDAVSVFDFPLGAGFVYRHRFGQRSLYGSVGLTAGLLFHRAATERGVVHRVDPDLQLPLRFAWTARKVGFSFALIQGFSARSRTYERRGVEVWHRIPYRIGFAVGIHFDVKVRRPGSRRADREPRGPA